MKKDNRNALNHGTLRIAGLSDEVVIDVSGKKKTSLGRLAILARAMRKPLPVLLSIVALSLVIVIPDYKFGMEDPMDEVIQDDIEKNKILQSPSTDYSNPDEKGKFSIIEHVVRPGENLSVIAQEYGVTIDTICGSNSLRSYDFIQTGVRLRIPSKDGILYRVKAGNNIAALAKKYRVSLEKILDENDLANPDFVAVGSLIFIPDAKPLNIIRGFMWPVRGKYITCGYGWRFDPFKKKYREFHQGIDLRSRYDWVRASKFGKVTYTGWMGGYGRAVVLAHPGGWKTLYAHLSRIIVRKGQYIKQGQSIGKSGNTGRSTGPHLHFEILKNGRHRNPYRYLHKK